VSDRPPSLARLLVLAIMVITTSTQPAFLLGATFFQVGDEFGIGPIGLGALTSSFFLTASIASAPMGRWVQRVGWQRAMRFNTRASAGVMLAIAVLARNFWTMGAFLVLAACFYGISNPAANLALSDHTDPKRRATIFGAKHAGIPASALLAGLAVPAVVVSFGWRWAVVGAAAIALGLSFLVPSTQVTPTIHPEHEPVDRPSRPPMSTRWLLGLASGSALATWAAIGLGTYLVSAALDLGFTESEAGWLQFSGAAISISARIGVGFLTDRYGWSGFGGIATLTGVGAVVFALLPVTTAAWFVIGVLLAYGTGWGWPGLMTFTVVNANRGSVASSSAITQAGVFVGAGAGPLLLGFVIERGSFDAAWLTVSLGLAGATAIILVVRARLRTASAVRTG
jgi:MFS family permease